MTVLYAALAAAVLGAIAAGYLMRVRNMHYWLPAHVGQTVRRRRTPVRHVYFCFADHYEPYGGTRDAARAQARLRRWLEEYPVLAGRHRDSDGRPPRHTFFYPEEEYDPVLLDRLAALCRAGYGDVEVHLHHDNDTADNLRATLERYRDTLHRRHGLLHTDPAGRVVYAFIHGNWALDNSRPDGRWCGVDNEIAVLVQTGCYADLTMPSAPSATQTRKINSIYFAKGAPGRRKGHDTGRDAAVAAWGTADELLLIPGPLTLNWREAKHGLLPRIENAEVSADAPPSAHRVALWGRCRVSVRGAEEHVFIKAHAHGATEKSMQMLFGNGFERLWSELERQYRDRPGCRLHYVTAWEMYNRIRALAGQPVWTR